MKRYDPWFFEGGRMEEYGHGDWVEYDDHQRAVTRLTLALEMVLLYHSPSPWNDEKRHKWLVSTGSEEATTKVLCDFIRAELSRANDEE